MNISCWHRTLFLPYRRMAYPHAIHRAIRYKVAKGWMLFVPLFIGKYTTKIPRVKKRCSHGRATSKFGTFQGLVRNSDPIQLNGRRASNRKQSTTSPSGCRWMCLSKRSGWNTLPPPLYCDGSSGRRRSLSRS